MATSFANLKKRRTTDLEKLQSEIEKINKPQNNFNRDDDRFWKAELDKSGSGYAVIRFLPELDDDKTAFVRVFNHGFQGPGGWYIENSLTTIGQKDPLSEYNSVLWNSGIEANKEIARKQKRRLTYFSNIYVVEDKANPQNEGKVFIFRFGKKIFDKLTEAMSPEFEDEKALNPFDFWEGANFKLKVRKVDGFWNYDKSEFESPSPMLEGEDGQLEATYKQLYSLTDFLKEDKFKTYEELKTKLHRTLTGSGVQGTVEKFAPTPKAESTTPAATAPASSEGVEEEEDTLSYFAKLADDE